MEVLLNYIAGKINTAEFENELYTNKELENLLSKSNDWSGTYIGNYAINLYNYLITLNYSKIGDRVNAIEAIKLYLDKEGISFIDESKQHELFDLLLDTKPVFVQFNDLFIEKQILPYIEGLTRSEKKKKIRQLFTKHFRFQSKVPNWIQSPEWIIKNNTPLFFVGQLNLKNQSFHDDGVVYIFLDESNGNIETVKQFY